MTNYPQQLLASSRSGRAQPLSSRCHRSLDGEASIKKGGIQSAGLGQELALVCHERSVKLSMASHSGEAANSRLPTFRSLFHDFAIKGTEESEGLMCLN